MTVNVRDAAALWDMRSAIQKILEFTTGVNQSTYVNDEFLQSAVERKLEILGEAARRVSVEFQVAHPAIDWRNTIGLRNLIAHRYDDVNHDEIWRIVQMVLPDFAVVLEALLPPIED
jgi:uncharacterized protein with HEPN domain